MELGNKLLGKVVGVDTSIFIYFIEKNPQYFSSVKHFFKTNQDGKFKIVTSSLTLMELLVQPFKLARFDLIEEYKRIFEESDFMEMINLTPEISEVSAKLRSKSGIRTPDAIQIGTAIHSNAEYFLTNDMRLKTITDISIIVLNDFIAS